MKRVNGMVVVRLTQLQVGTDENGKTRTRLRAKKIEATPARAEKLMEQYPDASTLGPGEMGDSVELLGQAYEQMENVGGKVRRVIYGEKELQKQEPAAEKKPRGKKFMES